MTYVLHDAFVIKMVLLILNVSLQMLAPGGVGAAAPRCYDELRGRWGGARQSREEKLKFTMPELQQAAGAGWKLLLHRMGNLVAGFLMSVSQKRLRFVVSLSLLCWWCLNNAFSKFSTGWENRELLAEVSICAEQQTGQSTKADGVRALERLAWLSAINIKYNAAASVSCCKSPMIDTDTDSRGIQPHCFGRIACCLLVSECITDDRNIAQPSEARQCLHGVSVSVRVSLDIKLRIESCGTWPVTSRPAWKCVQQLDLSHWDPTTPVRIWP